MCFKIVCLGYSFSSYHQKIEVRARQSKICVQFCLCNKVPYILMESSYYYYLLSISFGYVFCLHMLCIKVNRKQVWGRHTTTAGRNSIMKITKFRKQWTKNHARQSWTQAGPRVGRLASYMGQLAHHGAALPCASSTVRFATHMFYFHLSRFPF